MKGLQQNPSSLSHKAPARPLFSCCTSRYLWIFFINKISIIRAAFPLHTHLNTTNLNPPDTRAVLHEFVPLSEAEVRRLVLTSPCKPCDLDPIPTTLVRDCIDFLATPITLIVNLSLPEGVFPSCFKTAYVSPLLKKSNLDKENMKNYRPVSNLSFLFKILQEAVACRLHCHLTRKKNFQSISVSIQEISFNKNCAAEKS